MKKIFLITTFFLSISNTSYSQSGWFWQNPLPQGNILYDVEFLGNGIAIACGDVGTILRTTDNGDNWITVKNDSGVVSKSIDFYNSNTGWIISSYNGASKIYKTTNGGLNWDEISIIGGAYAYNIEFTSKDTGYAVVRIGSDGHIFKTTNSGNNWNSIFFQSNSYINNTYFLNNLTGYICGTMGIMITTNGGVNWINQYQISGLSGKLNAIKFINSNTGIAVGAEFFPPTSYTLILKTTNAGINWTATTMAYIQLNDLRFLNSNTGFICGSSMLKTTNAGNNWSVITLNGNSSYNSIDFSMPSSGLMVGDLGITLKSTNSGDNWINNFPSNRDGFGINSMKFFNKDIGYAVTGSKILKTTNGGNNWNLSNNISSFTLFSLSVIDSEIVYVAGGEPSTSYTAVLYKSTNGGINWIAQTPNITNGNGIISMNFVNSLTGYCLNWSGVSKTTNGGDNWINIGGYGGKSIYFVNSNTGFLISYTYGYKTTNGGANWSSIPVNGEDIYFLNPDTGYSAGMYMRIQKTTNGGITWIPQTQSTDGWRFFSIHFFNSKCGVAAGGFGAIARTTNGGNNWYYQRSPTNNELKSVYLTDTNVCFVAGLNNTILKTTNGGGMIGINNTSQTTPNDFILKQNYPNPFNPQTKIKFDVPANVKGQTSIVKLIVYDLLGREVATLVNEELKPGTYEADWDASSFSSGVYFYRIIADNFAETKKMVLMK